MKHLAKIVVVLMFLQLIIPTTWKVNAAEEKLVYTALGDSLASGVNENSALGKGYTDFITEAFEAEGKTVDYTKLYTCPGYKTSNVLEDVQNNIQDTNCPYKTEPTELTKLQERIAASDVITISAGANDVLRHITKDAAGQVSFDVLGVLQEMQNVTANYKKLLTLIQSLNPNVKIVVMGFYNPFPSLVDYKVQIDNLVKQYDEMIAATVKPFNVDYVVVRDLVAADSAKNVPNPNNIHLSEAGYKVVANAMYPYTKVPVVEEPTPETPQFIDVPADHAAAQYVAKVATAGIMNGSNGYFKLGEPLKRIQVTSMLTRLNKYEATVTAPFSDIAHLNATTRKELDAAYSNGIVQGSNNQFNPSTNITRIQLALMLLRTYEKQQGAQFVSTKALPFTDLGNVSEEGKRAVSFLYENNIINGTSPTTFSPANPTLRSAAAKIFAGILTLQ